ncbi:PorV/PorQ family protein [bacterium]|nr:PorV/PorQ family protein [bacterium]
MRIKQWIIAGLIIGWGWPTAAYALSGGELLREPAGARQAGMGEAHTAISGNLDGLYYNAASVADIKALQFSSMYALNAFENKNISVALGVPVLWWGKGGLAIGLTSLLGAEMEINYLDGSQEMVTSQQDIALTIGYGHQLTTGMLIGASIKAFHSQLMEEYDALALGADIGLIYKLQDLPGLSAGVALQNIGTEIKYLDQGDPMPTILRAGLAYAKAVGQDHYLVAGLDALFSNDKDPQQHVGIEYAWQDMLFLRTGYKLGYDIDSLTAGAGLKIEGLQIDYAFTSRSIAESIHRFSIGYTFSAGRNKQAINQSPETKQQKTVK